MAISKLTFDLNGSFSGVPTLTVAQVLGTSIAMIEKHYGHLLQKLALVALAKLVL